MDVYIHAPAGTASLYIEGDGQFGDIGPFRPFQFPACSVKKMTSKLIEISNTSPDGDGNGHMFLRIGLDRDPFGSGTIIAQTSTGATMHVTNDGGKQFAVGQNEKVEVDKWFGVVPKNLGG